jgi:hypothetical protein
MSRGPFDLVHAHLVSNALEGYPTAKGFGVLSLLLYVAPSILFWCSPVLRMSKWRSRRYPPALRIISSKVLMRRFICRATRYAIQRKELLERTRTLQRTCAGPIK